MSPKDEIGMRLPENVHVENFDFSLPARPMKLILKHLRLVVRWWIYEFIYSTNRWKYITQFSWNFNRFIGILETSSRLFDRLKLKQNQIYYTYWFNEWGSILAMLKEMGLKGIFITRAHGYDFDILQQGRKYFPFRSIESTKFEKIIHISEYGLQKMRNEYPSAQNMERSYLGIRDCGVGPINVGSRFEIVSCSNFARLKRIPLIAEVLSKLNVEFFWTHFGSGMDMQLVIENVERLIPSGNFSFRGFVSNEGILDYYSNNAVDLFINLSEIEGVPVSLMEAGSFGIPLIGCNTGGVPEIVDTQTGLLLDLDFQVEKAANEIEGFLLTKSRDAVYRAGIREKVLEKFSASVNYNEFINCYFDDNEVNNQSRSI